LILEPKAILETRERKLRSTIIREDFMRWKSLPDEDATWEGEHILEYSALKLLGESNMWEGRIVMSLSKLIWNKINYYILGPILEVIGPFDFIRRLDLA